MMVILLFALCAYGLFVFCGAAFFCFLLNIGPWMKIDSGVAYAWPWVWNAALVFLFGFQHTLMARASFKAWLTSAVPSAAERSVYVAASSLALILLMWLWQPMPTLLWSFQGEALSAVVYILNIAGWLLLIASTFQISHSELFGIQQALSRADGEQAGSGFQTPFLYRIVRHPMMTGILLFLWATPEMSIGHMYLSVLMTFYILIGTRFEERDLLQVFGRQYARYRQMVPMLVPGMDSVRNFRNHTSLARAEKAGHQE